MAKGDKGTSDQDLQSTIEAQEKELAELRALRDRNAELEGENQALKASKANHFDNSMISDPSLQVDADKPQRHRFVQSVER